jgi:hypothetical protein
VIWVITIWAFLGVLAIPVFAFFLVPRIRKALREKRKEGRMSAAVGVELDGLDEPLTHEMALTENVSGHGARVVTKKRWRPKGRVLVRLTQGVAYSPAKIAYCDALSGDVFAIGLRFSSGVNSWITRSGMWSDQPSGNPLRK